MKWLERSALPLDCQNCEDDCYNCDYAGARWGLSEAEELRLKRKSLEKAIVRYQMQIGEIDKKLEFLAEADASDSQG